MSLSRAIPPGFFDWGTSDSIMGMLVPLGFELVPPGEWLIVPIQQATNRHPTSAGGMSAIHQADSLEIQQSSANSA